MMPGGKGQVIRVLRSGTSSPGRLAAAALLGALAVACSVALLATSAYLISKAALHPPILTLTVAIVGVRAFGIGRAVFRYAERLSGHSAALVGLAGLRVTVYQRLELIAPTGLGLWRRGDLLGRFVDDVDSLVNLQLRALLPMATAVIVGLGSVVLAFLLLPAAGAILLAALLVGGIGVPLLTLAAGARAQQGAADVRARLTSAIVTGIESAPELVALQAQGTVLDEVRTADAQATRLAFRSSFAQGLAAGLGVLAQGFAVVASLIVATAAARVWALPGVEIAVVVLLPLAAYEAVAALPGAVLTYHQVRGSTRRVAEVLDAEPARPEPEVPQLVPDSPRNVSAVGLTVHWPNGERAAVADLSLEIGAGRRVAIVGPSGSGKSSLAMALLGFLPHTGLLALDGVLYRDLPGEEIRKVVGLLAQEDHIFSTSIEENLRLARHDATAEELEGALAAAGLADWVAELPQGLATLTGWRGSRLSGGQRQRLALARLLLGGHRIVILDEPTEHLDPVEGGQVLTETLEALSDRAVVLITHNIEQAMRCDEVVVLLEGRAVERGAPQELSAAGGPFARLLARAGGA